MPKKRRTRQQKLQADIRIIPPMLERAEIPPLSSSQLQYSFSSAPAVVASTTSTLSDYHYITRDLRKTLLVTATIVIIELVLFYAMR